MFHRVRVSDRWHLIDPHICASQEDYLELGAFQVLLNRMVGEQIVIRYGNGLVESIKGDPSLIKRLYHRLLML